ncbi:hypothetical protein SDJN03_25926, partial [Cucurbita argyrosperma subsp. sororia]
MLREFAKLKCFDPDLVDTDYRTARRFLLGLDRKIRNVVEAIAPTTYADALRVARAMEGTGGSNESRSSTEKQKRRRDEDDRRKSHSSTERKRRHHHRDDRGVHTHHRHREDQIDGVATSGGVSKEGKADRAIDPSVTSMGRTIRRPLRITDDPTQNRPSARVYASTSKGTENPDAVVTGMLATIGHLA